MLKIIIYNNNYKIKEFPANMSRTYVLKIENVKAHQFI